MKKWIIVALALILVLSGGLAASRRLRSATPAAEPGGDALAVEAAPVQRGTIERTLELNGSVVSVQRVEITTEIPGKIEAIAVREGARAAAGQLLVRLETAQLAAQAAQAEQGVAQARAALAVARARLSLVETGPRAQERAQTQNAVTQAEANLKNAEANLLRMQQLYQDGAVSRQELDAAVLQRDVARAQLDSARQQWSLIESGARVEDLQMARAQLQQAEAAYAAAQAAHRLARVQLDSASIRAPFAGRIAEVPVAVGGFVSPGDKIAVLYDDRTLEVEVHVGERDLALVRPDQRVTVRSQAAPAAEIAGTVRLIIPAADPASRAATVRIRLADPPAMVLPGTSATAQIVVERREQVLIIPSQALRRNGADEVVVVKDGSADVRQVLVGLRQQHIVQITYGVDEGELVVTLGPESLSDGQAVKVVTR